MNPEQVQFLNLLNLPGRFTVQQTAWYLGFPAREIPNLTRVKLLVPTGRPNPMATKLYAYSQLRRLRDDTRWMNRASHYVYQRTQTQNQKASAKRKKRP